MKAVLRNGFAIAAVLCLFLSACNNEQPTPQPPVEEPGEVFRTIYRFPMGQANAIKGEDQILSNTAVQQENSKVESVLARILEDVKSQKVIPTPIDVPEEHKDYGDDFALKMIASVTGATEDADAALLGGFEVDYTGTARDGITTWKTNSLRMLFIDPTALIPDRLMFELSAEQLSDYHLGADNSGESLVNYLNRKVMEGYPIMVESPVDTFFFRSFEQAGHFGALMEAGDVEHLVENPS